MDPTGRSDRDGTATRPDTVGVGWPIAPRWDAAPAPAAGRVLLTAGVVMWAPLSVLLAFLGAVALGGWTSDDGAHVPGALDRPTFDNVATAGVSIVMFAAAALLFAVAHRRVREVSRRSSLAFGLTAACWAPLVGSLVLAGT